MIEKDMTTYNKQYILRIVTESVSMVSNHRLIHLKCYLFIYLFTHSTVRRNKRKKVQFFFSLFLKPFFAYRKAQWTN